MSKGHPTLCSHAPCASIPTIIGAWLLFLLGTTIGSLLFPARSRWPSSRILWLESAVGREPFGRDFEGNQVPHPAHLPCLGCTNCHPHRWRFRASSSRVSEFLEPSCTTIRRLSPWRLLETRQAPAASVVPVLMPS